jgi:hypothetical protein
MYKKTRCYHGDRWPIIVVEAANKKIGEKSKKNMKD